MGGEQAASVLAQIKRDSKAEKGEEVCSSSVLTIYA